MPMNKLAIAGNFFLFIEVIERFQVVYGTLGARRPGYENNKLRKNKQVSAFKKKISIIFIVCIKTN